MSAAVRKRRSGSYSTAFIRIHSISFEMAGLIWRGVWFFEGSFPVALLAEDGTELARGFVTADGDWMTEEFVPFEGELAFEVTGPTPAVLVLMRDNPSDLPEHDAAARYELTLR